MGRPSPIAGTTPESNGQNSARCLRVNISTHLVCRLHRWAQSAVTGPLVDCLLGEQVLRATLLGTVGILSRTRFWRESRV